MVDLLRGREKRVRHREKEKKERKKRRTRSGVQDGAAGNASVDQCRIRAVVGQEP